MLGNVSRTVAESSVFLRYEGMMQALLSINPYLAPNFVAPDDIPWPILRPGQTYPPPLARPGAYNADEIVDFVAAYQHWSGESLGATVRGMLSTWTVVATRFRSGDLHVQVGVGTDARPGYAIGLMGKVLKVLRELQHECKRKWTRFSLG